MTIRDRYRHQAVATVEGGTSRSSVVFEHEPASRGFSLNVYGRDGGLDGFFSAYPLGPKHDEILALGRAIVEAFGPAPVVGVLAGPTPPTTPPIGLAEETLSLVEVRLQALDYAMRAVGAVSSDDLVAKAQTIEDYLLGNGKTK